MANLKTHKAVNSQWREEVLITLNLEYTIVGKNIIFKGDIGNYNTLVDLLVSERIKLGINPY